MGKNCNLFVFSSRYSFYEIFFIRQTIVQCSKGCWCFYFKTKYGLAKNLSLKIGMIILVQYTSKRRNTIISPGSRFSSRASFTLCYCHPFYAARRDKKSASSPALERSTPQHTTSLFILHFGTSRSTLFKFCGGGKNFASQWKMGGCYTGVMKLPYSSRMCARSPLIGPSWKRLQPALSNYSAQEIEGLSQEYWQPHKALESCRVYGCADGVANSSPPFLQTPPLKQCVWCKVVLVLCCLIISLWCVCYVSLKAS